MNHDQDCSLVLGGSPSHYRTLGYSPRTKSPAVELVCCRSARLGNSSDHRPTNIREGSSSPPDAAPTVASFEAHRFGSFRFPHWDETCSLGSGDQHCPCWGEQHSNVGWYRLQTAFPHRSFHQHPADGVPSVPRCHGW